MKWNCQQLESRLNGYLEGKMAALELQAADEHARDCPNCSEWHDARMVRAMLAGLDELETPPGFETRVLANTLATPDQIGFWQMVEDFWRALMRPRVAFSVTAAAFSLMLIFVSMDVSVRELEVADLSPINIYHSVDRKANLAYASGVRYLNELRVVYEIRNQWAALRGEDEDNSTEKDDDSQTGSPDDEPRRDENRLLDGSDALRSVAAIQIHSMRENL